MDPAYEEIIFQGRNKRYGAYVLRITYPSRLLTALFISTAVVSLLLYMLLLLGKYQYRRSTEPAAKPVRTIFLAKAGTGTGPSQLLTIN